MFEALQSLQRTKASVSTAKRNFRQAVKSGAVPQVDAKNVLQHLPHSDCRKLLEPPLWQSGGLYRNNLHKNYRGDPHRGQRIAAHGQTGRG